MLPADFIAALAALRTELDLPLIAVETTTHTYRSGQGRVPVRRARAASPTCSTWWGGGQTGYLHTLGEVVHQRAADPGLDVGRRRAFAGAPASPAARGAPPRCRRRLGRARPGARVSVTSSGPRRVPRDRRRRACRGDRRRARRSRHRRAPVPGGRLGIIPALDQVEAAARSRCSGVTGRLAASTARRRR